MSTNDEKVREMIAMIIDKRCSLGTKPRLALKTNGLLKREGQTPLNLHAVNSINTCVDVVSGLLKDFSCKKDASEVLGVRGVTEKISGYDILDWIEDFKGRVSILQWQEEDKKLKVLEKQLKDLRSNDAKVEDALSSIMDQL